MTQNFTTPKAGDDVFPPENGPLTEDRRTEARLCAVQATYQLIEHNLSVHDIKNDFETVELKNRNADKKLFSSIFAYIETELDALKQMISGQLAPGWTLERLDPVVLSILITATAEFFAKPETPATVIIDEYMKITAAFNDDQNVGFVNGMLVSLAKKVRPTEKQT